MSRSCMSSSGKQVDVVVVSDTSSAVPCIEHSKLAVLGEGEGGKNPRECANAKRGKGKGECDHLSSNESHWRA